MAGPAERRGSSNQGGLPSPPLNSPPHQHSISQPLSTRSSPYEDESSLLLPTTAALSRNNHLIHHPHTSSINGSNNNDNRQSSTPTRRKSNARKALRNVGRRLTGRFQRGSSGGSVPRSSGYGSILTEEGVMEEEDDVEPVGDGGPSAAQLMMTLSQEEDEEETGLLGLRQHGSSKDQSERSRRSPGSTLPLGLRSSLRASRSSPHHLSRGGGESLVAVESHVVPRFESVIRYLFLLVLSFFLGTCFPSQHEIARHALEYAAVAWSTCVLLLLAVWCSERKAEAINNSMNSDPIIAGSGTVTVATTPHEEETSSLLVAMEEGVPAQPPHLRDEEEAPGMRNIEESEVHEEENGVELATEEQQQVELLTSAAAVVTDNTVVSTTAANADMEESSEAVADSTPTPAPAQKMFRARTPEKINTAGVVAMHHHSRSLSADPSLPDSIIHSSLPPPPPLQKKRVPSSAPVASRFAHPALDPLYITDALAGQRVNLNDAKRMHVMDTDYFSGHMMMMIRTPDVDDPSPLAAMAYPDNEATAEYLRGKQRRFEFQFQGKLKKVPTGRIYFACELDQSIKLGMIQRAFVGAAMAFVKSTNPFFHYSISGDPSTGEPPHMAFPFLEGMNLVVATPPGQTPPTLGGPIEESAESQKRRKKGGQGFSWNLEDTYTFSLWSAYVDFLTWKCLNLPGIRPFGLTSVLGRQPIHMTVYEMEEKADSQAIPNNSNGNKGPHIRLDESTLVSVELCQTEITDLGAAARKACSPSASTPKEIENVAAPHKDDIILDGVIDDDTAAAAAPPPEVETNQASAALTEVGSAEETEEEEAAAELGEGIYIRSGDPLVIKEASDHATSDETSSAGSETTGFVAMGGGFCVLQEQLQQQQPAFRLVIEKPKTATRRDGGSSLIKSGDTVLFKLLKNDGSTMYLTIHRGWWLKWVALAPTKNGHFTIHTTDSHDTQYLTVGGSFWLQHKRWSKFSVGVQSQGSATYGGRLLGLFKVKDNALSSSSAPPAPPTSPAPPSMPPHLDDDGWDEDAGPDSTKAPVEWMQPVHFRAYESSLVATTPVQSALLSDLATIRTTGSDDNMDVSVPGSQARFPLVDIRLDVPVWIELMNRTERVRHLAYVVRVVPRVPTEEEEQPQAAFVRIRTGRDLAEVMRVGQNWRNNRSAQPGSPRRRTSHKPIHSHDEVPATALPPPPPLSPHTRATSNPETVLPSSPSHTRQISADMSLNSPGDGEYENMKDVVSDDSEVESHDGDVIDGYDEGGGVDASDELRHNKRHRERPRKMIRKLARSVSYRTTSAVVKVSKNTVSAGKSIIPIRPKNPPQKEPNQKTSARSRRRTERELHVAVSRGMKRMDRSESHQFSTAEASSSVLAGELSAPEQSCRSVSRMLMKMSSVPLDSEYHASFSALLHDQIIQASYHDGPFLQGKAIDLGVTPSKKHGEVIVGYVVARCLWEKHWREEWCGVFNSSVVFYSPLTDTPSLELSLADIQSFRLLDKGDESPLPGLPILVLETAWQCYYLAFRAEDLRQKFFDKLESTKDAFDSVGLRQQGEKELWKARFWQGFRSSFEASSRSAGDKGKWAEIVHGNRKKRRVVLNNRRMAFDLPEFPASPAVFSEELVVRGLSFRLESLLEHPEALVRFLDATSQLQNLPLKEVDFMGPEALCLFVNLYHCLLQHALLLTVNGSLSKRSCGHFFRTSCYEIGGDVFSLAELQLCVIRGRMSRPVAPKAPFFDVPRKSQEPYDYYALGFTSPLTNFVLNTGNTLSPRQVAVFSLDKFYEQLSTAATAFVRQNVTVDETRRTIFIPKVCDVFRGDFSDSGSVQGCLKYCLALLEEGLAAKIQGMLQKESAPVNIRFQPVSEQYHSTLQAYSYPRPPPTSVVRHQAKQVPDPKTLSSGYQTE